MKNSTPISTGSYSKKLADKASKIEKHAKSSRIRRIILSVLMVLVAASGILYGVSSKTTVLEEQYRQFLQMPERSSLSPELLAYKDTYPLFVREFLGNEPSQSLMGGFFYSGGSCLICPNESGTRTVINLDGRVFEMTDFLADQINFHGDYVLFREPASRKIYRFDMVSGQTTSLDISNAGQFVVCGDEYYYIDLSNASLVQLTGSAQKKKTIVADGVVSFAVAGNDLFILDRSHVLKRLNLADNTATIVGENITAFTFNGSLWFQNDTSVYQKKLGEKNIECVDLGIQCNRLLGVAESEIIFESEDGVYLFNNTKKVSRKIGTDLFSGMANDMVLWFRLTDNAYRLERLS